MGAIDTLIQLLSAISPELPSELDITLGNDVDVTYEVQIQSGNQEGKKFEAQDDVLTLYPSNLEGDEYRHYRQLVRESKKEEGSVSSSEARQNTNELAKARRERFKDVLEFFEGIISSRHYNILRAGLYIRDLKESGTIEDIDEKKRDIANKYGYDSYYLIHLVSAGYFDAGRHFQTLYLDLEHRGKPDEYVGQFELVVGEQLIALFVNSDDTVHQITAEMKSKFAKYFRYDYMATFVDLCGIGDECEYIIEESVEQLTDENEGLDFEDLDRGPARVVRFYPSTLRAY